VLRSRRMTTLVCSLLLLVGLSTVRASADDSEQSELAALLQDEGLSENGAQALVNALGGTQSITTSDYDACPDANPNKPATYPNIAYKGFKRTPSSASIPIYLDEYDPSGSGPFSVMILVHGGGFWRGCKYELQDVAWEGAGRDPGTVLYKNFVVLNIDYRLACDPFDPNLQSSPILPMCGWPYTRIDLGTGTIGAATHDVQDAVRWVSTEWSTLPGRPAWDGRVVLLGGSAGGTFAYSAVAPSPNVGGAVTVNDLAAWSGALRFDLMSNGHYPCEAGQSNDPTNCSQNENTYLGCNPLVYPDPVCVSAGRYTDASPNAWYTNTSLPHAFFGNGGGGTEGPELIALQSALDFEFTLQTQLLWQNHVQYLKCIVDKPVHGRALRNNVCDDGVTGTVWYRTSKWLYGIPS